MRRIVWFLITVVILGCADRSRPKTDDLSQSADSTETAIYPVFTSVDSAIAAQKTSPVYALDLSRQELTALPAEIAALDSLVFLDLSVNQLDRVPPELFGMKSLREIDLSNNSLTELPAEMKSLVNLTALHLRFNRFDAVPEVVVHLAKSGRLEYIDLEGNNLTLEKVKELQSVLDSP